MKNNENISIATVITCVISFILSFIVFNRKESISEQKFKFLVIMLTTFCIVYVLVVIVRYLVYKLLIISSKLKLLTKKYHKRK